MEVILLLHFNTIIFYGSETVELILQKSLFYYCISKQFLDNNDLNLPSPTINLSRF